MCLFLKQKFGLTDFCFVSGPVQQGEAGLQVLPPAPAPQGSAPHQRPEPPRTQECASTADAAADPTRTDSHCGKLYIQRPLW